MGLGVYLKMVSTPLEQRAWVGWTPLLRDPTKPQLLLRFIQWAFLVSVRKINDQA